MNNGLIHPKPPHQRILDQWLGSGATRATRQPRLYYTIPIALFLVPLSLIATTIYKLYFSRLRTVQNSENQQTWGTLGRGA